MNERKDYVVVAYGLQEVREKVLSEIKRSAAILRPEELAVTVDQVLDFAFEKLMVDLLKNGNAQASRIADMAEEFGMVAAEPALVTFADIVREGVK
jgi:hypothetical protein